MNYKEFNKFKMIIAFALGAIIAAFITQGNYIIPLVAVFAALLFMLILKRKVTEVISDERLEKIAGRASHVAYFITALGCAIIGMIFMALGKKNSTFLSIAYTLSYVSCGIIFIYVIAFKYYSGRKI